MFDEPPAKDFPELYRRLNKKFYESFDADYFMDRAITLAGTVAKPKEFAEVIAKGYEIGKIKIGEMKDIKIDGLVSSSKKEIVINSYHAIETLFRLMFAHVESEECPWLGILELNNPSDFKSRLRQLVEDKYFKDPNSVAIPLVFSSSRKTFAALSDNEWDKHQTNIVEYVLRMANDLLKSSEYNVHKHGAALFETQFGFNLADVLSAEQQETYLYLSKNRDKQEREVVETYQLTYKFAKWEMRFATTVIASYLTNNLINIATKRFELKESVILKPFNDLEPSKFLETGIISDSINELLFETKIPRKVPKKK